MNQEPAALPNVEVMVVQASHAKIRSGPSRTARAIGSATKGSQVKVVSRSGNWVEVETDAHSGWIGAKLLGQRPTERK